MSYGENTRIRTAADLGRAGGGINDRHAMPLQRKRRSTGDADDTGADDDHIPPFHLWPPGA